MDKDTRLWFECTFGDKSHLNLAGKIIFSPIFLYVGVIFMTLDFLFTKRISEKGKK